MNYVHQVLSEKIKLDDAVMQEYATRVEKAMFKNITKNLIEKINENDGTVIDYSEHEISEMAKSVELFMRNVPKETIDNYIYFARFRYNKIY